MKSLDNLFALLFLLLRAICVLVKKAIEITILNKDFRTDEVQKSEKFLEIVLQGCPGNEESTAGNERANNLREDGVNILDPVSLVDDDIFKGKLLERGFLDEAYFVGRDANFEILRHQLIGDDLGTFILGTS